MTTTRRELLRLGMAAAGLGLPASLQANQGEPAPALPEPTAKHLPRWRGFNLLNKFMAEGQKPFEERDFADIAELGFDFVRLPLDYRCWTDPDQLTTLKEPALKEIDQAVELRPKARHPRPDQLPPGPGFTVAKPPEPDRSGPMPRF